MSYEHLVELLDDRPARENKARRTKESQPEPLAVVVLTPAPWEKEDWPWLTHRARCQMEGCNRPVGKKWMNAGRFCKLHKGHNRAGKSRLTTKNDPIKGI